MPRLIQAPPLDGSDSSQTAMDTTRNFSDAQVRDIRAMIAQAHETLQSDVALLINNYRIMAGRLQGMENTVGRLVTTVTQLVEERNNRGNNNGNCPELEREVRQLRTDINRMLEANGQAVNNQQFAALEARIIAMEGLVRSTPDPQNLPQEVPAPPPSEPIVVENIPPHTDPYQEAGITQEELEEVRKARKKKARKEKQKKRKNAQDSDPSDGSDSSDDSDNDSDSGSISSDDTEYSVEDEDERGGVFNRKKRGNHRDVKAIKPSNREYRRVLDYRYYRLRNRRQKRDGKATKAVRKFISRLEVTLKDRKFDGVDKIKVLSFLAKYVNEADLLGMSEAQAVLALPTFLKGNAAMRYEAANSVGTWPETVQYLLLNYATDAVIEEAVADLRNIRQRAGESEVDYSTRLTEAELRCGNVHRWHERKLRFIDGLLPVTKPKVARYNRTTRDASYWDVLEFAQSEGEATRAGGPSRRILPLPQQRGAPSVRPLRRAFMLEPSDTTTERGHETGGSGELHLVAEENDSGLPTDTSNTTTTVETIDATRVDEPEAAEAVLLTDYNRRSQWTRPQYLPHADRNTRINRPGWVDNNRTRAGPSQPRPSTSTRLICYTCYQEGHISPDCPGTATPQMIVRTYESLPRDILRIVPPASYWNARDITDAQLGAGPSSSTMVPPPRPAEVHPRQLPQTAENTNPETQGKGL